MMTVAGLITDNDETAYREEVRDLTIWCKDKNFSLNVIKTKEMILDYSPILIDEAVVEQVESFKLFCCPHHQQTNRSSKSFTAGPSLPGMATAQPLTARHYRG